MTAPVLEVHHPDDEILAAFVDNRASEETREKVIAHMAACTECRDLVVMTSDIVAEETNVVPMRKSAGRWIAPLAAAAAIGGALFFLPDVRYQVFGVSPDVLVGAASTLEKRSTPGRTSLGIEHKYEGRMRGAGEKTQDPTARVEIALGDNETSWRTNLRTRGIGQMLIATSYEEFDLAVKDLEAALANADPRERDAITIDLTAALLGRAKYPRGDDHSDAQRAYHLADEIWKRTKSPDAAWNRAAALHEMGKFAEAVEAWKQYLTVDPNSPWATEARQNIDLETEP